MIPIILCDMKFNKQLNKYIWKIGLIALCLFIFSIHSLAQAENKTPTDFSELKKLSAEELELKTRAHDAAWGISRIERWDLLQEKGDLVFSLPQGLKAVAPAQIIGTYNSEDKSWLWAWANPSIEESLKKDAQKVREYGEKHRIKQLTESKWRGSEQEAWTMAAVAAKLSGAQGVYRGPASDTLFVFITFGKVELSKK